MSCNHFWTRIKLDRWQCVQCGAAFELNHGRLQGFLNQEYKDNLVSEELINKNWSNLENGPAMKWAGIPWNVETIEKVNQEYKYLLRNDECSVLTEVLSDYEVAFETRSNGTSTATVFFRFNESEDVDRNNVARGVRADLESKGYGIENIQVEHDCISGDLIKL